MSFKVVLNANMRGNLAGFHPFTTEVIKARLLNKWKLSCLGKYDSSFIPEAYVKAYLTQTSLFSKDLGVALQEMIALSKENYRQFLPTNVNIDEFIFVDNY